MAAINVADKQCEAMKLVARYIQANQMAADALMHECQQKEAAGLFTLFPASALSQPNSAEAPVNNEEAPMAAASAEVTLTGVCIGKGAEGIIEFASFRAHSPPLCLPSSSGASDSTVGCLKMPFPGWALARFASKEITMGELIHLLPCMDARIKECVADVQDDAAKAALVQGPKMLKCFGVVKVHLPDLNEEPIPVGTLYEYAAGGTLGNLIDELQSAITQAEVPTAQAHELQLLLAAKYAHDAGTALEGLKTLGCVFNDTSANNWFACKDGLKMGDFGLLKSPAYAGEQLYVINAWGTPGCYDYKAVMPAPTDRVMVDGKLCTKIQPETDLHGVAMLAATTLLGQSQVMKLIYQHPEFQQGYNDAMEKGLFGFPAWRHTLRTTRLASNMPAKYVASLVNERVTAAKAACRCESQPQLCATCKAYSSISRLVACGIHTSFAQRGMAYSCMRGLQGPAQQFQAGLDAALQQVQSEMSEELVAAQVQAVRVRSEGIKAVCNQNMETAAAAVRARLEQEQLQRPESGMQSDAAAEPAHLPAASEGSTPADAVAGQAPISSIQVGSADDLESGRSSDSSASAAGSVDSGEDRPSSGSTASSLDSLFDARPSVASDASVGHAPVAISQSKEYHSKAAAVSTLGLKGATEPAQLPQWVQAEQRARFARFLDFAKRPFSRRSSAAGKLGDEGCASVSVSAKVMTAKPRLLVALRQAFACSRMPLAS